MLRPIKALLSAQPTQPRGLSVVSLRAISVEVHNPQVVLRIGIASFGKWPPVLNRRSVVTRDGGIIANVKVLSRQRCRQSVSVRCPPPSDCVFGAGSTRG
ncbi:MAG: hypothetical protein ACI95S_001316 [Dinoroseobacter sp.]|jgi:hypothetical protein